MVVLCSISVAVMAQKTPVGIVSIQDTVKSVQVGVISSVATDGGHGVQLSVVSNAVSHRFDGIVEHDAWSSDWCFQLCRLAEWCSGGIV